MNPLFNALSGSMMQGGMNPAQLMAQLKSNPLALLRKAGFNVPDNISNPQAIIQHLANSGQINQGQINRAQQMAQNFHF